MRRHLTEDGRLRRATVVAMSNDDPYRSDPLQVERLREENAKLRAQIAAMTDEPLLPHRSYLEGRCQKCGLISKPRIDEDFSRGPSQVYEAAYTPSWWARLRGRRAHGPRMRRDCICKATYYERTKDQESP